VIDLSKHERVVYCDSGGEDGIIEAIFAEIGTTNRHAVEFGAGDGEQNNTRLLREQGWTVTAWDSEFERPERGVCRERVTARNVGQLLLDYRVPPAPDLLVVDIDSLDFDAIMRFSTPRVACVEYNASYADDRVVAYDPELRWDGTDYYGASLDAFNSLMNVRYGYMLVYCTSSGVNAFFVHLKCCGWFLGAGNTEYLYRPPNYGLRPHAHDTSGRGWVTSAQAMTVLT